MKNIDMFVHSTNAEGSVYRNSTKMNTISKMNSVKPFNARKTQNDNQPQRLKIFWSGFNSDVVGILFA